MTPKEMEDFKKIINKEISEEVDALMKLGLPIRESDVTERILATFKLLTPFEKFAAYETIYKDVRNYLSSEHLERYYIVERHDEMIAVPHDHLTCEERKEIAEEMNRKAKDLEEHAEQLKRLTQDLEEHTEQLKKLTDINNLKAD